MPNLGGLLAGQHDSQKERAPPSRPIPVAFPSLTPPEPSTSDLPSTWTDGPSPGIPAHFLGLRKPSDVSFDTLALLNVSFQPQCDFETLLSSVSDEARAHLPPKTWLDPPEHSEPSSSEPVIKLLCNGRRVPEHNEFYVRAKELFFKNEAAFSNLTRKANGAQAPLRLAHFRKFWEGLDNMAYYWDNSLDEYLPPKPSIASEGTTNDSLPDSQPDVPHDKDQQTSVDSKAARDSMPSPPSGSFQVEEPRKKAKTEASSDEKVVYPTGSAASGRTTVSPPVTSISSSMALPARTAPPKVPWAVNMEPPLHKPVDLSKGAYKGYRIGNGAEMPDQYRLECVRAFLEPIVWAFGVTLVPHRRPPVLTLDHLRFPVRMNSVAWRGPQDRIKARQGWMEGPILGIQCRPDTNFGHSGNLQAESVLDLVRELGGMLLLAQERAREGKTEKKAGEGKWWTTKHRWGGGPGGEVGEATGASDAPSDTSTSKVEEKLASRPRLGSRDRRRPTPAEVWKILRPGNPLWDPKVVYEAIGKDQKSAWDDVSVTDFPRQFRSTADSCKDLFGIVIESSHQCYKDARPSTLYPISHGRQTS